MHWAYSGEQGSISMVTIQLVFPRFRAIEPTYAAFNVKAVCENRNIAF
jgi:hypothetical protein